MKPIIQALCSAPFCSDKLCCQFQTLCGDHVGWAFSFFFTCESMVSVRKSKHSRKKKPWWLDSHKDSVIKSTSEKNNRDLWHRLYLILFNFSCFGMHKSKYLCVCVCVRACWERERESVCKGRDGLWQSAVTQLQQQKLIRGTLLRRQKTASGLFW